MSIRSFVLADFSNRKASAKKNTRNSIYREHVIVNRLFVKCTLVIALNCNKSLVNFFIYSGCSLFFLAVFERRALKICFDSIF